MHRIHACAAVAVCLASLACGSRVVEAGGTVGSGSPSGIQTTASPPYPTKAPGPTVDPVTPQPSEPASRRAGVYGTVLAGPTCPVERPDSPCPDRPVPDARVVARAGGGRVVGRTRSGADGSFRMRLPVGTYEVTATSTNTFGCDTVSVRVVEHRYTRATISCDTGIR